MLWTPNSTRSGLKFYFLLQISIRCQDSLGGRNKGGSICKRRVFALEWVAIIIDRYIRDMDIIGLTEDHNHCLSNHFRRNHTVQYFGSQNCTRTRPPWSVGSSRTDQMNMDVVFKQFH